MLTHCHSSNGIVEVESGRQCKPGAKRCGVHLQARTAEAHGVHSTRSRSPGAAHRMPCAPRYYLQISMSSFNLSLRQKYLNT